MGDFKVIINFDLCDGCAECNAVCPSEVFADPVDGKTVVAREDDCIGCQACVSACPNEAIVIEDN
ncbi:MAG: 4Fe-4S dicluster domain-containing protein [Candidatus Heimdallarchaeota archaeon]|nr:4Fe-4S dicluster domain-containing protein [Candidatus Heimdallarchaeota archaeon]